MPFPFELPPPAFGPPWPAPGFEPLPPLVAFAEFEPLEFDPLPDELDVPFMFEPLCEPFELFDWLAPPKPLLLPDCA